MIAQNIMGIVADIKEQLQAELSHPYVKKFIHHPEIDEDKLLYFCSFLQYAPIKEEQLRVYVIALMMVQVALDTHDLVSTEPAKSNEHLLKERQLTVLAGDYYSGLYYYYLSKDGHIEFMKQIASAIKRINIEKMKYYLQQFQSIEDVMTSLFSIETALFECVCSYYEDEDWKQLLTHLVFIKRLKREKMRYEKYGESTLFETITTYLNLHKQHHYVNINEVVEEYIINSRKVVTEKLNNPLKLNKQLTINLHELVLN